MDLQRTGILQWLVKVVDPHHAQHHHAIPIHVAISSPNALFFALLNTKYVMFVCCD
jgi:hypothetical protein